MIGSFMLLPMSMLDRLWVKDPGHSSSCDLELKFLGTPLPLVQLLQTFRYSRAAMEYPDIDEVHQYTH